MSTRSEDAFAADLVALRHDLEAFLRRASVPSQDAVDLADEIIVKAWEAAQGALIMGRHAEAWQLLHEHARRYPRGQLARRRERLLREIEGP